MKKEFEERFVLGFSGLLGAVDSATGLALIFAPIATLGMMGVDTGAYQPALLRFIGAFVFANGSLYFWGIRFANRRSSQEPLRYAWMVTAWVRLCVAIVTGSMVGNGALGVEWISVPITDAVVGLFQIWWIVKDRSQSDEA